MFNRRPTVLVREYKSSRDLQRDANRLARDGYTISGTSSHTRIGIPTLTRGFISTRITATYHRQPTHA